MLVVKNPPTNAGDVRDTDLIPGLGRAPKGGHGNPLQYCCLECLSHGQKSLVGCSPQGHKDTTKVTYHMHELAPVAEKFSGKEDCQGD